MTAVGQGVAVVTGAASGIGRALALELAARGCALALNDVDASRLAAVAGECEARGARVLASAFDVADPDAMQSFADQVAGEFTVAHLLFNNAGIAYAGPVMTQPLEAVQRVLDVNLRGVIHGTQAFLPLLAASGGGHVVNISSLFGILAMPGHSAYCASKFAVRGYTEALASEFAAAGLPVRASCVHPGGVATNIAHAATMGVTGDRDDLVRLFQRLARCSPERAARVILRGVRRNRIRILVGADARALSIWVTLFGSGYVRMLGWLGRRFVRTRSGRSAAQLIGGETHR